MATVTLKGKSIHTNGELPLVNTQAPNFRLVDVDLNDRTLDDFKGKRKLLSIVPSLDTGVCVLSSKKFDTALKEKKRAGVALIISADLPFAQKRICGLENLTYVIPLSTMRSSAFAKDYGILIVDGPLAGVCARAIVVLDEDNKVVYRELVPELTQEPNYDKALKALLE